MEVLSTHCEGMRNAPLVAHGLGLELHPELSQYMDVQKGQLSTVTPHTLVASIVYRCDPATQYRTLPQVKTLFAPSMPPKGTGDVDDVEAGGDADGVVGEPRPVDADTADAADGVWQNMMHNCAFEHFRSTCGSEFFSVSPAKAMATRPLSLFTSLQQQLFPKSKRIPMSLITELFEVDVGDDFPGGLPEFIDIDFDDDAGLAANNAPSEPHLDDESFRGHVFFRVVNSKPSTRKRPHMDSGLKLSSDGIAVTRHKLLKADLETRRVDICLEPSSSGGVNGIALLHRPSSFQSLSRWTVTESQATIAHTTLTTEGQEALQGLVQHGAFADTDGWKIVVGSDSHTTFSIGLQQLKSIDVAQCVGDDDLATWHLKPEGQARMSTTVVLQDATSVVTKRPGVEVCDMTLMELMLHLKEEGWRLIILHKSDREPAPFSVGSCRPKVWWVKETCSLAPRLYLRALATSKVDLQALGVSEVRHGQKTRYYKSLFGLSHKRERIVLEDDVGAKGDMQSSRPIVKHSHRTASRASASSAGGPSLVADAPIARVHTRAKHEKSFSWGPCLIIFKV
jgi:hypothetical protein